MTDAEIDEFTDFLARFWKSLESKGIAPFYFTPLLGDITFRYYTNKQWCEQAEFKRLAEQLEKVSSLEKKEGKCEG